MGLWRARGEVFELLSKKTKQFFEKIEDIAVTLDKVTVQRCEIFVFFLLSINIQTEQN